MRHFCRDLDRENAVVNSLFYNIFSVLGCSGALLGSSALSPLTAYAEPLRGRAETSAVDIHGAAFSLDPLKVGEYLSTFYRLSGRLSSVVTVGDADLTPIVQSFKSGAPDHSVVVIVGGKTGKEPDASWPTDDIENIAAVVNQRGGRFFQLATSAAAVPTLPVGGELRTQVVSAPVIPLFTIFDRAPVDTQGKVIGADYYAAAMVFTYVSCGDLYDVPPFVGVTPELFKAVILGVETALKQFPRSAFCTTPRTREVGTYRRLKRGAPRGEQFLRRQNRGKIKSVA